MNAQAVTEYMISTFEGLDMLEDKGNIFFYFNPDPEHFTDRTLPFSTLIINDAYDTFSNLNRPDVFRLNMPLNPDTYRALFGAPPTTMHDTNPATNTGTNHDYAALNTLMPHPIYASMSWVCIVNPDARTFETLKPYLRKAYKNAVKRYKTRVERVRK